MVKKVLSYAVVPVLAVLFVFCIHNTTFQARAFTPPALPTTIPTDISTLKPITADISGEFTDANFKKAVWQWLGKTGDPGAFSLLDIQNRIGEGYIVLNVSFREISSLKGLEYFDGLTYLGCTNNMLMSLPPLPTTLETLYCQSNQLTALPDLPATLENLTCHSNKLTGLPALPGSLQVLSCESNQLTGLPAIPSSLRNINVVENNLTELPTLPNTVTQFKGEYNYLDVFSISLATALKKPNYSYKPQYRIQYTGPETIEIEMGKTVTIDNIKKQMASVSYAWSDVGDVSSSDLTFTSSNNSVAKVDSAGGITGVSIGTTHINIFLKGIDSKFTKTSHFVKIIADTSTPEPTIEPSEPTTEPSEPTTEPSEPTTEPSEPTTEPSEPTTEPSESTTEPPEPTTEPPEPSSQYGETSAYAIPFMNQAADLGIITDRLKGKSMIIATTRQEFAELAVKFYEKVTGKTAPVPTGKSFTDCNNPEVLKAYGLKITYGTGDGKQFEPNAKLTRQQMAAMIERTLKACYPNIVIDTLGQSDFKDQKDFASYSIVPAKFMAKYEITVGDGQGHFNPNDDCLRQQTFIFLVKAYNFRVKYIYE